MYADQITEARSLATPVPQSITAVDTFPCMVVQYVPSLGTGGATAGVSVAGGEGAMTFSVDSAVAAGADLVGTLGVLLMGGYASMGFLVDKINATAAWRAYLVGSLREDDPTELVAKSGAVSGETGITFYHDSSNTYGTGGSQHCSTAISGEKFVSSGVNGHVTDWNDQCENSLQYGSLTATFASPGATSVGQNIKYYTERQGQGPATQIGGSVAVTDGTAKEQGEANVGDTWVTGVRGTRLIVRLIDDCVGAITAPAVTIVGQTAVLKNDRIVATKSWGDA